MWRQWSTRTSVLLYGTSVARTKSVPCGGITFKTHRYVTGYLTFDLFQAFLFLCQLRSEFDSDFTDFPCSPQGLIFVVDSNDRERVAESAEELAKMVCVCLLSLSLFQKWFVFVFSLSLSFSLQICDILLFSPQCHILTSYYFTCQSC